MLLTISSKDSSTYVSSGNVNTANITISRFEYSLPYTLSNVKEIVIEDITVPFSYYSVHRGNNIFYPAFGTYVPSQNYYVASGTYTPTQLAAAIQTALTNNGMTFTTCTYSSTTGRFSFLTDNAGSYGIVPVSNDKNYYPENSTLNCSLGIPYTTSISYRYALSSSDVPNQNIIIDSSNDTGNAFILTVVVPHGTYTCVQLATYLQERIETLSGRPTTVQYIGISQKFEIICYSARFFLQSGALWTTMGFTVPSVRQHTLSISNAPVFDKYIKIEDSTNILSIINQDTGPTTLTYTMEEGSYDSETLMDKLNDAMPFTVSYSQTSLKFTITHPTMNFTVLSTSLGGMMGFDANINASLQNGVMTAIAPKTSTLSGTNNILVRSYGISNLKFDRNSDTTIYSLNVNATPDNNICATPKKSIKLQTPNSISSLDFGLTTDDNKALDLNGRNWSITLKFVI